MEANNLTGSSNETDIYECTGATDEEMKLYYQLAWWMDGVVQVVMGLIGVAGNSIAIPVLLSKKLNSIFNKILCFLAIFDNIFILCSILEAVRKNFGALHDVAHVYAFAYFLYQLQSMAIVSSIFTTVVLALERCLAVAKPIEYHNAIQGTNPWRRVVHYLVPVIILSVLFNTPKFFEIDVVDRERKIQSLNETTNLTETVIRHVVTVKPTDLRMNDYYIFYYNNLAKLVVTGIVPFAALCIFNFKIYCALRRRRNVMGPHATAAHQQQLNEDNRQALVLFGIVIIFLVSNVPRVLLNLHEVFTIEKYKQDMNHGCFNLPLWVLLGGHISQLFLMANSSMNFFIYCLMSSIFREVLAENISSYSKMCRFSYWKASQWNNGQSSWIRRKNHRHTPGVRRNQAEAMTHGEVNDNERNPMITMHIMPDASATSTGPDPKVNPLNALDHKALNGLKEATKDHDASPLTTTSSV